MYALQQSGIRSSERRSNRIQSPYKSQSSGNGQSPYNPIRSSTSSNYRQYVVEKNNLMERLNDMQNKYNQMIEQSSSAMLSSNPRSRAASDQRPSVAQSRPSYPTNDEARTKYRNNNSFLSPDGSKSMNSPLQPGMSHDRPFIYDKEQKSMFSPSSPLAESKERRNQWLDEQNGLQMSNLESREVSQRFDMPYAPQIIQQNSSHYPAQIFPSQSHIESQPESHKKVGPHHDAYALDTFQKSPPSGSGGKYRAAQKLSTLDSFYPRSVAHQTLEPKERVEMFICKKRMTFLLQIFYQWRSIAKMGLNRRTSHQRPQPRMQQMPQPYIPSEHGARAAESNYFTFNYQHRQNPNARRALEGVLASYLKRQQRLLLRFKLAQWYKASLYMKMIELEQIKESQQRLMRISSRQHMEKKELEQSPCYKY